MARVQHIEDVIGKVGGPQIISGLGQDPRDVDGHVADADDHDIRRVEREAVDLGVGMPAVPGDEVGRREAAGKLLAFDVEPAVDRRAVSHDDRVVVLVQLVHRDVLADLDVAEEADAVGLEHLAQRQRDRLDLLVVGRDPVAHEPVRARQTVDDVDRDAIHFRSKFQQRLGCVDA